MFGPALIFDTADEDGSEVRLLNVCGAFQSATYTAPELRSELVCLYHRNFAEVVESAFGLDWPLELVVLGGGGYSFPRWATAHLDCAQVWAVEIDPAITELARERFYLSDAETKAEGRLHLVNDDGWSFLERSESSRWRVIVNDAFSRNKPLGPMETETGAHIIHEHLSDDGIYLANVIAALEGKTNKVLSNTLDVFAAEFDHVYLIPERPEEPKRRACNVMIASDRALTLEGAQEWKAPVA